MKVKKAFIDAEFWVKMKGRFYALPPNSLCAVPTHHLWVGGLLSVGGPFQPVY
jgi:hypothetical protein